MLTEADGGLLLIGTFKEADGGLFDHCMKSVELDSTLCMKSVDLDSTPGEEARACEPKGAKGVCGEFARGAMCR